MDLLQIARTVLLEEVAALQNTAKHLDETIGTVTQLILDSDGRLVVSGIGKSAIIAQKIVATMNSTGTPSLYMHAADAIHGDLGMIGPSDIVLLLSKSGETAEIRALVPLIARMGNTLVSMTANPLSYLAQHSQHHLHTAVNKEADPNNLAPTASTTAQVALGDALAMCLLARRGFTAERFASLHPGGSLGKQLYLRVIDLISAQQAPTVAAHDQLPAIIMSMTKGRVGACVVVEGAAILGIITDGDLRRMLDRSNEVDTITARAIMTKGGHRIGSHALAVEALDLLQKYSINQVLVTDGDDRLVGVLHLHELIREGLV